MALTDFYESGPYVHSHLFNFRANVGEILQTPSKDGYKEAIDRLIKIRNNLEREARTFLDMRGTDSGESVSEELFFPKNNCREIAMIILRSREFLNILTTGSFDWDKFRADNDLNDAIGDIINEVSSNEKIPLLAAKMVEMTFKDAELKRYNASDLQKHFKKFYDSTFGDEKAGKYATKKVNFQKKLEQSIRRNAPKSIDNIGDYFERKYREIAREKGVLTYNQRQNEIDNFLKTLKPKFEAALAKANIGDISNATGSLGEELLEPIFESDDTIKWKFYNVGAKTEKELQEEMKQLGIDIDTMDFKGSPSSTKSGSDGIIVNSRGEATRAQAKNSVDFINELIDKTKTSRLQFLKIQDSIKYVTLRNSIINSNQSFISNEDWRQIEYLISNIIGFRSGGFMQEESDILKHRHKGDYKSVAENKEMSRYKLTGIQEELNRKISQAITYFIGVDLKELTNVKIKSSNLFFMVDNVFLFPTSLLLTYIINQLEDGAEQLDRLYATLNTMTTSVINSEELGKKKQQGYILNWHRGDPYGSKVLAAGIEKGEQIIKDATFARINLRLDVSQILKSAYNVSLNQLR